MHCKKNIALSHLFEQFNFNFQILNICSVSKQPKYVLFKVVMTLYFCHFAVVSEISIVSKISLSTVLYRPKIFNFYFSTANYRKAFLDSFIVGKSTKVAFWIRKLSNQLLFLVCKLCTKMKFHSQTFHQNCNEVQSLLYLIKNCIHVKSITMEVQFQFTSRFGEMT